MAMVPDLQCSNVAILYQEGRFLQDRELFDQMTELYRIGFSDQALLNLVLPAFNGRKK
jgi:hypothetical protein